MTFAWKSAGLTYNRYLAVAARTVRRSLNPELRVKAESSAASELKVAKWQDGKQGDLKDVAKTNVQEMTESTPSGSK